MTNVIQFPSKPSSIPQHLINEAVQAGFTVGQAHKVWTALGGNLVPTEADIADARLEKEKEEAFPDTSRNEVGDQYEATEDLDIAEIAKLVRKDIASGKKLGYLPKELKTSVTIERYAGGQSLRIEIKDLGGMDIFTQGAKDHIKETGCIFQYRPIDTYNEEYTEVKDILKKIHDSYNFDKSDPMTDYFHVRYYGDINLDYDLKTQYMDNEK